MEPLLEEEKTKLINSSEAEIPKSTFESFKGLLFMFFSCLLKSLFSILIKYSLHRNELLTSYHLLFYKVNFMLILFLIFAMTIYQKDKQVFIKIIKVNKREFLFLIIRAILSIISISLTSFSLKYMRISNVYSIYYLYPGIVVLLSNIILNEKVRTFDYICLISCFIGVICVLRPGLNFFENNIYGILSIFVLLSALFKAFEDIILRYIGKKTHFLLTPFLYSLVGFIIYFLQVILFNNKIELIIKMSLYDWIIIFIIASLAVSYQSLMALAFGNEKAGRASMVNYFQILFTFLADIFIFNRNAVLLDYIGILLIFGFNFTNGCLKVYYGKTRMQNDN